jgi:hypothetical protein
MIQQALGPSLNWVDKKEVCLEKTCDKNDQPDQAVQEHATTQLPLAQEVTATTVHTCQLALVGILMNSSEHMPHMRHMSRMRMHMLCCAGSGRSKANTEANLNLT